MKRRADYSRLVSLDLSPSEAVVIGGLFVAVLDKLDDLQLPEGPLYRQVIEGALQHIRSELALLNWPTRNKAPYPV